MEIIDIKKDFGEALIDIRSQLNVIQSAGLKDIIERGFNVPETLHKNRLLFIGMNPSFSEKKPGNNNLVNYYIQPSDQPEQYLRYYKPLNELAAKVEMEWTHWDLFYLQETKQHTVKQFDKNLDEQFELSMEIIRLADPKMIVVNNAHASGLIYEAMKKPELDKAIGTYKFNIHDDFSVPIFFCSMLSGQRAMDTHTKERLAWHIDFVNRTLSLK